MIKSINRGVQGCNNLTQSIIFCRELCTRAFVPCYFWIIFMGSRLASVNKRNKTFNGFPLPGRILRPKLIILLSSAHGTTGKKAKYIFFIPGDLFKPNQLIF